MAIDSAPAASRPAAMVLSTASPNAAASCIETVESGKMTKDLALLVGGDQEFQTTQEFLAAIDENLQAAMA